MGKVANFVNKAQDLEVYKRAYKISLDVHKTSLTFPKIEQYALADQMRRSSKGICANLAEGFAKQSHSKAESGRFISMAVGSCSEMETWVCYAYDLEYITIDQCNVWLNEYAAVHSMLIKLRDRLQ